VLIAVTRAVSPTITECELTHRARDPIDVGHAEIEHAAYEETLRSLGATVVRAPPEPALPDAVFVEDTALVLDEVGIITRPGASTRRPEIESIGRVLSAYRPLLKIESPGTLDGGDVLPVGRTLYVGQSSRTNREGVCQLEMLLSKWDYEVIPVPVDGCLHLKSAVTQVAERLLLINADWVSPESFGSMDVVTVSPAEPDAANALRIGSVVIYPSQYPETAERLERAGVRIVPVPCTELAKAEGGVTCCSIVFEAETMPLGLRRGQVIVVPYDPRWPALFEETAAELRATLGSAILAVDHVGSTAVPGLSAKPILDVLVSVADFEAARQLAAPLTRLGYEFRPNEEIPDRHYFRRPIGGEVQTHHLSLAEPGSRHHKVTLAFRDALRRDPELSAAYARLKAALAQRFPFDRPAYIEGKTKFVMETLAGIGSEYR